MAEKKKEYQTYRERLSSSDSKEILAAGNELITLGENYFQNNIFKKLCTNITAREGILPDEWVLKLKFEFPFVKKYLAAIYPIMVNAIMQNEYFWGNLSFINTDYEDSTAIDAFNLMLKKTFYGDNNPYDYFVKLTKQMVDYGYVVLLQDWCNEETEIDKIDVKIANEIRNKETDEIEKIEYEQVKSKEKKLLRNSMRIRALDIFDCRLDPTAKDQKDWRFFFHYLNLDYDTCVQKFKNFKEICNFKTEENSETSTTKSANYEYSQSAVESRKNVNYNAASNIKIIEFWDKWGHRIYFLCLPNTTTATHILKLAGVEDAMQNMNPYSLRKEIIPATVFYYNKNDDDTYAKGAIDEIYPLYILMIYLLSLAIIEEIKRVLQPVGIVNGAIADTTELIDAISGNSRFFNVELKNNSQSIKDVLFQIQQMPAQSLFQLQQYCEGMIQAQLNITDFQLSGVMNNKYNQTLGGIEKIMQKALEKFSFLLAQNNEQFKQLVKIAISLNCQNLSKPEIIKIEGKNNYTQYIKLVKDLDADKNSPNDFIQVNNKNEIKTLYLSDFSKIDFNFDILFGLGDAILRFSQLQKMLELATMTAQAGIRIDIEKIVKEMSAILRIPNVIKSKKGELKKIENEEGYQKAIAIEYQNAVKTGIIQDSPEAFIAYMKIYIPEPDEENDDHLLHYQSHQLPTYHKQLHLFYYERQQAAMVQMQEALRAQQGGGSANINNADGRTAIAQNNQAQNPQMNNQNSGGGITSAVI